MSRIEIAMEKAAKLREGKAAAEVEETPAAAVKEAAKVPPITLALGKLCPKNPFLVHLHDPLSPTAEEYRKLKSALVEMTKSQDHFRNAVLVTSSVPNEGKTLTALNLAMTLAQELDHTVLLVDADLRRPALHEYLEVEQGIGLSDVLLDKAQIDEAIVATGIGKLSIMRAGSQIDNPAELLSSSRMKGVIDELKHCYRDRYIIFDTPPLLPFAETRALAHLVDGVLFVIMERLVSQANVQDAMESLKGCHVFGTVYNAALGASHEERYSHYHRYYNRPGKNRAPA